MRLIIVLILILKLSSGIAQTVHDSLYQLWQSGKTLEEKAHALDRLFALTFYSDPDTSLFYISQTLELGNTVSIDSIKGMAYKNMASYFIAQGKYQEMDSAMNLVAQHYDTSSVTKISSQYFLYKGHYNYIQSQYELAPINYLKAYVRSKELKDTASISSALTSLGNCFKATDNLNKAVGYFEEANQLMLATGKPQRDRANICINLGTSYVKLGEEEKAEIYFYEAIEIAREHSMLHIVSLAARNLAQFNLKRNNLDIAQSHIEEALRIAEQKGFLREEATALQVQGDILMENGHTRKAITAYQRGLSIMRDNHFSLQEEELLQRLASSHEDVKEYKLSLDYIKEYNTIKDSIYNLEKIAQLESIEEQFQSAKKDNQLAKQQLQIQKRTSQRNLAYAGGIGILALGTFLFYRNQKNQKLNTSKIENLEKQQKLMAMDYMVQGQEEERKRIAQDLHDGLGGLLSTARIQLKAVHNEIERLGELDLLNKAEVMIDNACSEVRRIAHDMMPGALMDLGLIDATEDLAFKLSEESGIDINTNDNTSDIILTDNQKIQLYRAIQEILNNAVKHSGARNIPINFSNTSTTLTINISDDGKGFDIEAAKQQDGIGMKNIKSRVKYLNGIIAIDSSINHGTHYRIEIPI